jgi:hypothetical protein
MNKIQLRPPPPSLQIEQACAFVFLNELLTLKRKVAKASAENAEGAGRRTAEVALEMRLLQASLYDFLREQIKARRGQSIAGSLGKGTFKKVHDKFDPDASDLGRFPRPKRLVEVNQEALLKRPDPQLRVAPAAMQKLHHKNIDRLKDLPT